jgi:hypothetical protein
MSSTQPKKSTKVDELLAAISQTPQPNAAPTTTAPIPPTSVRDAAPTTPDPAAHAPIRMTPKSDEISGRGISFYFQENETKRIRELAAWLSSQGIRTSDSLIIKSCLRIAKPNAELLAACRDAMKSDGRYKVQRARRSK